MSASDSIGYFVELGEYNLIIARATLGAKPRTIEAVKEVWLGDAAAADGLLSEVRPAGSGKALALLRIKGHSTFFADANQAKSITSPDAVENFLKTALTAENLPANWAWYSAANGLAPQGGARWLLDAAPSSATEEALDKIRAWTFELVRCQSAPLTLAGAITTAAKSGAVLLVDVSEHSSTLFNIGSQGITGATTVPVGLDALAGATQTALGLKFRGSAARLMFNDSYDFSDAAASIAEPLSSAIKGALPSLGSPAPAQVVLSGILARQTWISQAVAKSLGLAPFSVDAGWFGARGLTLGAGIGAADIAPSWLGVLNAASAYEIATPGGARAWNPMVTNTPVAAAQAVPAIAPEPPKPATPPPAVIPAIIQEPPKPAAPAKPAIIPAIIQDPPKAAAPAKPEVIPAIIQDPPKAATPPAKPSTPVAPPKPAVIITPPAKPAEPAKPATPPAKPATPPAKPAATPPAKPAEPAKPATPSAAAKPPAPAPAKPVGKPEPAKPAPVAKPAPAPVASGSKPATAAPFPPKKSNLPLIIAAVVVVLGLVGGFIFYTSSQTQKQAEQRERDRQEAEAKIKAEARARAEAENKARLEREAREKERLEAEMRAKNEKDELLRREAKLRDDFFNARGILVVATEPAGASVTVGEMGTKTAPVTWKDLRLGPYTVTVSMPGYDSETRSIEIKANETTDLGTVSLKRQVGTIEISSEPSNLSYEVKPAGALFVNPSDVRSGQTPATLTGLPVGSYQVTITRPEWPSYTNTVTVEKNGSVRVNGEFAGGTVVINSNIPGADILRDNQVKIGTTPKTINGVPPGSIMFVVTSRGFDPITLTGKVESGKTLTLTATLLDSDRVMKLSELDERPVPIAQADPDLSSSQRAEGGTAIISLVVGRDGVPTELKVEQASNQAFGKACLAAAAKWRFKPGVVRGKPAKSRVTIPFKISAE
ncbi:MAG: TonB family protein [Nibricoccus sp.]